MAQGFHRAIALLLNLLISIVTSLSGISWKSSWILLNHVKQHLMPPSLPSFLWNSSPLPSFPVAASIFRRVFMRLRSTVCMKVCQTDSRSPSFHGGASINFALGCVTLTRIVLCKGVGKWQHYFMFFFYIWWIPWQNLCFSIYHTSANQKSGLQSISFYSQSSTRSTICCISK